MALLTALIRRMLWLLLLGLVGGAVYRWWSERQAPTAPAAPEWPPISVSDPASPSGATSDAAGATGAAAGRGDSTTSADGDDADADEPEAPEAALDTNIVPDPSTQSADDAPADEPAGTASVVNALVDAPEARSTGGADASWIDPEDDGSCPVSHPIKANDNSGIFHVPGGRFYDRTKAERCYVDADAAAADGYRRAKS